MTINKIAFGNSNEAYIEDHLTKGLNIIFSYDNNKGKTIVMQSALYALGGVAQFPASFNFNDFCYYVDIILDSGEKVSICRKKNSFAVKNNKGVFILDSVSELKHFLDKNCFPFPRIIKNNIEQVVYPGLLYQIFFIGQDKRDTSNIANKGLYRKEDFWNMVYSIAGCVSAEPVTDNDSDSIKREIKSLKDEKKTLLEKNKILKNITPTSSMIFQNCNNLAMQTKIDTVEKLRDQISLLTKEFNHALQRRTINEKTLEELGSLNNTPKTGDLFCIECGSNHIGYRSGDNSYNFDISDDVMRQNIKKSIEEKIAVYNEDIERLQNEINSINKKIQDVLKEEQPVSLESIILSRDKVIESSETDSRLVEIDKRISELSDFLRVENKKNECDKKKRQDVKNMIVNEMNVLYKKIDPNGSLVFDDLFSDNFDLYSGSEETEYYLAKLYSLANVLKHSFPIMIDDFRSNELSTEKESIALNEFSKLRNQIILTATLKNEEKDKYDKWDNINRIDYSTNKDSHILNNVYVEDFKNLLSPLMITP